MNENKWKCKYNQFRFSVWKDWIDEGIIFNPFPFKDKFIIAYSFYKLLLLSILNILLLFWNTISSAPII